jgi:hypothetical protein
MLSGQALIHYYSNQVGYTWSEFCINMKLFFERSE